uniref:Uncharacterized protein n=1 Tax=Cacopsylla melanoneura TaxID=428564 RepID=A0A8D8ZCX1_9HEMI
MFNTRKKETRELWFISIFLCSLLYPAIESIDCQGKYFVRKLFRVKGNIKCFPPTSQYFLFQRHFVLFSFFWILIFIPDKYFLFPVVYYLLTYCFNFSNHVDFKAFPFTKKVGY